MWERMCVVCCSPLWMVSFDQTDAIDAERERTTLDFSLLWRRDGLRTKKMMVKRKWWNRSACWENKVRNVPIHFLSKAVSHHIWKQTFFFSPLTLRGYSIHNVSVSRVWQKICSKCFAILAFIKLHIIMVSFIFLFL